MNEAATETRANSRHSAGTFLDLPRLGGGFLLQCADGSVIIAPISYHAYPTMPAALGVLSRGSLICRDGGRFREATTMEYEIRDVPLDDFPGYRVSFDGRVFGKRQPHREMTPTKDKDGYLTVQLRNHGKRANGYVASLVLLAFHGPRPDGCEAMHTPDPTRTNNRADNLKWGTHAENMLDVNPEDIHHSKLTWNDVDAIRESYQSVTELAEVFGVAKQTIRKVINCDSWHPERRPIQHV